VQSPWLQPHQASIARAASASSIASRSADLRAPRTRPSQTRRNDLMTGLLPWLGEILLARPTQTLRVFRLPRLSQPQLHLRYCAHHCRLFCRLTKCTPRNNHAPKLQKVQPLTQNLFLTLPRRCDTRIADADRTTTNRCSPLPGASLRSARTQMKILGLEIGRAQATPNRLRDTPLPAHPELTKVTHLLGDHCRPRPGFQIHDGTCLPQSRQPDGRHSGNDGHHAGSARI